MNICPKCKEPIVVPEDKDFVICKCGEVIIIMTSRDINILINELENPSQPNEALKNAAYNRENEGETDDSGRQQENSQS